MAQINERIKIDFRGVFDSFAHFYRTAGVENYVVRFWHLGEDENTEYPSDKRIIGITTLPDDVILHTIDVTGMKNPFDTDDIIDKQGIDFIPLSYYLKNFGFQILPYTEEKKEN